MALTCLAQPEIPESFNSRMDEYLFFDNNFNVALRLRTEDKAKENLLSKADQKPVTIFIFEADISTLGSSLALSKFVENADLDRVHTKSGKILIPCLESDKAGYQALRLKFRKPILKTVGRKVLGHSTYYVEPVSSIGGFFAKFASKSLEAEQKFEREVLMNDYIKSQLSELPLEMRRMTMDSFMAVNLSDLGVPYSVSYRSAERVINAKEAGVKTYPGHGLLGCDSCLSEYAMKLTDHQFNESKAIDR